jgi:PAS domain S-box-containing protein
MRWQLERRLILAAFISAAVILALVGWESYRHTIRVAKAAEARKHSYEVGRALDETRARLDDAETGQRGFLLTGDEAYLEPYREAIKNLDRVTDELKKLTSDNPDQQERIQRLEPLIESKLAELQRTIDLRRKDGLGAANQVVLGGQGKQLMDKIRAVLGEMGSAENSLRAGRTQEMTDALTGTARIVVAGNLTSIVLLLLVFAVLIRELSYRKRAQEALARSEKWLSTTLGSIGDAVIATDMNGAVTFMNSVAQSLTGWSQTEAIGKSMDLVFDIVNKDTKRPVENPVKKVFREGKVVGLADHTLLLSKNGREYEIEDSAAPILQNSGEGFGVVLVFRDITEKNRAEEETRRQKDLLQLILASIADGVVVADANGKFLLFNVAAEQVLGMGATNSTPGQWSDQYGVYLPDAVTAYPANELPLVRAMRGESVDAVEVFIRNANVPEGRLLSIAGRPLKGTDGALQGGVVVFHDMTLQKRTQEALVRAKEEAERATKFKDQFLSTMSHELRTPLNAVLGFSDLLADERYGPLNDRQRRYIDHIHTGGKHLLKLISDILDLSKIEAGRMELTREDVTVAAAFTEVISALYPLAEKKSQALLQEVDANLRVRADVMRFKQVLMNLAGNAIKFTPEGGRVELAARQVEDQVRIEVRDNGPGIPPQQQQRIFEAFFRLTETGTATEGTGLGLAITARLVELHGSKLGIESQPGEGSCFYFLLPLVALIPDRLSQTSVNVPRARKAPRILIVEDNAVTGQLIQSQLASSGYETLKCTRPERATEMAAEHQPDAITLDLLMQPMHGLEVLLQLKNDPRTSKIPVIVVTIVDQPGVGTALGADEYLIKPVDKATLLAAVERCLRSRGGAAPTRTILVVEDDVSTLEMIVELLKVYGYAVSTATDGAQARASVAHSLPELVILDLVLPKMSGFELLAEWRSNPRTAELSVFVLTSKDLTKEEEKYIHAHAESLFRKQNSWREPLIKQLERVVTSLSLENA